MQISEASISTNCRNIIISLRLPVIHIQEQAIWLKRMSRSGAVQKWVKLKCWTQMKKLASQESKSEGSTLFRQVMELDVLNWINPRVYQSFCTWQTIEPSEHWLNEQYLVHLKWKHPVLVMRWKHANRSWWCSKLYQIWADLSVGVSKQASRWRTSFWKPTAPPYCSGFLLGHFVTWGWILS